MRILLLNPHYKTYYPQPPIGLAMVASVLEKDDYEVELLDLAVSGMNNNLDKLAHEFNVVGMSVINKNINGAIGLSEQLKRVNPKLIIILGGPHVTLNTEEVLRKGTEVDIVVRGEGELTAIEVFNALKTRQPISNISGISYRNRGRIIHNPAPANNVDINSLPMPAYHLLPMDKYKIHPPRGRILPFVTMVTSRGCPFQCKFCAKPIFGSQYRARSADEIINEILYLQKYHGIKEVGFFDDVFVLDRERVKKICRRLINEKIKIAWTCEARVDLVDMGLLRLMKAAGCYAVAYGIESASLEILEKLGKNITPSQSEDAIKMTHWAGMQSIGYFMLGSPGETIEQIKQTINFAQKLKLDYAQFSITKCYPGTDLYKLYSQPLRDIKYLIHWSNKAYRAFYLRPSYFLQRITKLRSMGELRCLLSSIPILIRRLLMR